MFLPGWFKLLMASLSCSHLLFQNFICLATFDEEMLMLNFTLTFKLWSVSGLLLWVTKLHTLSQLTHLVGWLAVWLVFNGDIRSYRAWTHLAVDQSSVLI